MCWQWAGPKLHSLLSAHRLIGAYFHTTESDKRMRLLTRLYGICIGEENAFKEVTMTLAAGFYSVGVALGLPPSELNKIRQNCPRDCDGASEAGEQNPALAQMIAAAHQGKVISIWCLSSFDRWIVFTASRKRQQSNDEGIPRPKQPHIEDGEEIMYYTLGVGRNGLLLATCPILCARSIHVAVA